MQRMVRAFCLAPARAGSSSAARIAIMAMTTSNSIKVNAPPSRRLTLSVFHSVIPFVSTGAPIGGCQSPTARNLVFCTPHVLSAARGRENWFSLPLIMSRFSQTGAVSVNWQVPPVFRRLWAGKGGPLVADTEEASRLASQPSRRNLLVGSGWETSSSGGREAASQWRV